MDLLHEVCSLPTAPFAEGRVTQFIERFVRERRRLRLSRDRVGNLLIELPGRNPRLPRWVFTAHTDHPGFVAEGMVDGRTLRAVFRGSVRPRYIQNARVRFFVGDRQVRGVVTDYHFTSDPEAPRTATVRLAPGGGDVAPGSPGMFDLGEGKLRGRRFSSRAIDDLGGLAAALAMMDELARERTAPAATVAVLATRAEEVGFIGAIAAARRPTLLRKTDRLVAIECSAEQPYARQGAGVIVRVGDRTSVFHSGLTYFLSQQAATLAEEDETFRYQRALMPGGSCEATAYDVYGFAAAAVCVPLGNYHNMNAATGKLGAEYIDVNDWRNMVKLFVRLARFGHEYEPGHKLLKARLEERFERMKQFL